METPNAASSREVHPLALLWSRYKGVFFALALVSGSLLASCTGVLSDGAARPGGSGGGNGTGPKPGTIDANGNLVYATPAFNLSGAPFYSRAVLLTNAQWARSVKDLLRLNAEPSQANSFLAPVEGFTLFPNNEIVLEVTNQMRESYQLAAAEIAQELLADPGAITRVNAGNDPGAFIRTFGRRAFRRPLTEKEVAGYMTLYNVGTGLSGDAAPFTKGANLVIEGMLQSPHFLYRTELSPGGARLSGYEVAAKLSFWILGTAPSDALLDRAAAGELDTPAGVSAVADEMLERPAASQMVVDLYATLFKFSRYRDVIKEDPQYKPAINAELEEVSRLFFKYIYERNMGVEEMLTFTQGFVGPLLAEYYGISPAPAAPVLTELGPGRPGYFSQVPYLMLMGDGSHSDAIHRGVFLNFYVMCAKLPSPPAVVPAVPPPQPNQSNRERIAAHTGPGTCGASCHGGYINPLGFAFENFDGLGRPRTMDAGKPVDTSAAYPIGDEGMVEFDGAQKLMSVLAGSTEAHSCFAKNLVSYALSRDIVESDRSLIEELASISMSDVGSIKKVLRGLVKSPSFLNRPGAI